MVELHRDSRRLDDLDIATLAESLCRAPDTSQTINPAQIRRAIKPAQNYPNWPDPCLSIFAAPGNNGITGNVLGSNAPPVIQYNCSGNPAWQQWSPAETNGYTVPTSCTNNCPPAPTGAHTLQHEVVTPLERKTDLACIRLQGDVATPATPGECRYFNPELVANGWLLHDENNFNQCLGRLPGGLDVGLTDCTTTSIWDDRPIQTDGLTFPLVNTSSGLCLGGTTSPKLEYCNQTSNQLWYDATQRSHLVLCCATRVEICWACETLLGRPSEQLLQLSR
jgi:hypothetical protein